MSELFPGFEEHTIEGDGADIFEEAAGAAGDDALIDLNAAVDLARQRQLDVLAVEEPEETGLVGERDRLPVTAPAAVLVMPFDLHLEPGAAQVEAGGRGGGRTGGRGHRPIAAVVLTPDRIAVLRS